MNGYSETVSRRAVLTATGLALTGLAGCLSDDSDDENNGGTATEDQNGNTDETTGDGQDGDNGGSEDSESDETRTDPILSTAIETIGADCGGSESEEISDTDLGAGTVRVAGVLPAPNPCHEATLESAEIKGKELSLVIDVADATADDEGCTQCQGAISYDAAVELADGTEITQLLVEHRTGGTIGVGESGSGGVDQEGEQGNTDEESSRELEIVEQTIETVSAECGSTGGDAGVEIEGTEIVITGVLGASDPCHEAVLSDAAIDGDGLRVAIDTEPVDEEEMCVACLGAIEYEASVRVSDVDPLSTVEVNHVGGGSYAESWASDNTTE